MIRLICEDGEVVLARPYFQKMSLFDDPQIARADSYELQCKPSTGVMNILLRRVYAESAHVEITKDNFSELKSLCRELGFTGLDAELREFECPTRDDASQEILALNDRISRHDKLLLEVQHQLTALSRLVNDKFRAESEFRESMTQQLHALEAKVEMVVGERQERSGRGQTSGSCKQEQVDGDSPEALTREELQLVRRFSAEKTDFLRDKVLSYSYFYHRWIDHRNNREVPVAIKEVYGILNPGMARKWFWREASILAELRHETVISLTAIVPEERMIIVPWMKNGTLADVLRLEREGKAPTGWNATKKSTVLFGTAVAMAYIHLHNITHRRVAPESVWLNDNFEPVLSEFDVGDFFERRTDYIAPIEVFLHVAPEAGKEDVPDWTQFDVYSYAVFLYRMFTDSLHWTPRDPPKLGHAVLLAVEEGNRLVRVPEIPDFLWDLITVCWDQNPENRPPSHEIVNQLLEHTEEWAFPGTDLGALREYQARVVQGVPLSDADIMAWITRS